MSGTHSVLRRPLESALAAAIGVMHQGIRLAAPPDRHQQGVRNQLGGHAGAHRPADHPAREQVDHRRHIEPALSRPDVGEVGDPLLVRALGLELPIQKVRRHVRNLAMACVLRHTPALWPRPQGLQAHQPFDPVQAAFDAVRQKVSPDAPRAVSPVTGKEADLDLLAYGLVASGSGAGRSVQPGMKARPATRPSLRIAMPPARCPGASR
ncbi:hypothetical protein ACVWZ6_002801 [Bradyrhizobium sp. GM6.1]